MDDDAAVAAFYPWELQALQCWLCGDVIAVDILVDNDLYIIVIAATGGSER
jgi:hypothetical protein